MHAWLIAMHKDTELHVTTEPALESGTPPMTPEIAMMLPVEVPVHLQLIVAPETGPVARPSRSEPMRRISFCFALSLSSLQTDSQIF